MSPAGHWPQLHAAIESGADAVYFGLHHFSARAKVGFALPELAEVMRTLHRRGVRGYLTFNTLVFEHELQEAARTIAAIAEAGTDAVIVQDAGIARLVQRIAPQLEIHASTQMSITSAAGVELARQFGASRVPSRANFPWLKSEPFAPNPTANSRCSSMARSVLPIPASAFLPKPGADAALIEASARRPADCRMN